MLSFGSGITQNKSVGYPEKYEKIIWDTRFYNLSFGYKNMHTK
jgi:hypothetical protein